MVLPLFLLSVAAVFTYSTVRFSEADGLFWFTVISYILLSLYFFFLKRPYLRIGSSEVATRKWGRERVAKFSDLEKIRVQPGTVSIVVRGEKSEWVFSRSLNLFKTDRMAERLEQLAKKHRVPFERSLKVR